eukprot:3556077-Amphidinium_carterae.1
MVTRICIVQKCCKLMTGLSLQGKLSVINGLHFWTKGPWCVKQTLYTQIHKVSLCRGGVSEQTGLGLTSTGCFVQ